MPHYISDLLSKLRLLESAVPDEVSKDCNFSGIRINENGTQFYVAMNHYSENHPPPNQADQILNNDPVFNLAIERAELKLPCKIDHSMESAAGTLTGDRIYAGICNATITAESRNIGSAGRVGWYFFLNDQLSAVTAYHVACLDFDATTLFSTGIFSCGENEDGSDDLLFGRLCSFDRISPQARRLFDCAIIEIIDPQQTDNLCRNLPYPEKLFGIDSIENDDTFHILGLSDERANLQFKGIGSRRMPGYGSPDGKMFHEQLFFAPFGSIDDDSRLTQKGDSGSVIVHRRTNTVIGLVMGIDNLFTVANPIYRKPWRYCGSRAVSGFMVPCFETR